MRTVIIAHFIIIIGFLMKNNCFDKNGIIRNTLKKIIINTFYYVGSL